MNFRLAILVTLAFSVARADAQLNSSSNRTEFWQLTNGPMMSPSIPALPGLEERYLLAESPIHPSRTAYTFAAAIGAEGRDVDWAPEVEEEIRAGILRAADYLRPEHIQGVECRTTVCGAVIAVPTGWTGFNDEVADQLFDALEPAYGLRYSQQNPSGYVALYMEFDR